MCVCVCAYFPSVVPAIVIEIVRNLDPTMAPVQHCFIVVCVWLMCANVCGLCVRMCVCVCVCLLWSAGARPDVIAESCGATPVLLAARCGDVSYRLAGRLACISPHHQSTFPPPLNTLPNHRYGRSEILVRLLSECEVRVRWHGQGALRSLSCSVSQAVTTICRGRRCSRVSCVHDSSVSTLQLHGVAGPVLHAPDAEGRMSALMWACVHRWAFLYVMRCCMLCVFLWRFVEL